MELTIGQNGIIELGKVFNPIELVTGAGETMKITMRDSGFEFTYMGDVYHAKRGVLTKIEKTPMADDSPQLRQTPYKVATLSEKWFLPGDVLVIEAYFHERFKKKEEPDPDYCYMLNKEGLLVYYTDREKFAPMIPNQKYVKIHSEIL